MSFLKSWEEKKSEEAKKAEKQQRCFSEDRLSLHMSEVIVHGLSTRAIVLETIFEGVRGDNLDQTAWLQQL